MKQNLLLFLFTLVIFVSCTKIADQQNASFEYSTNKNLKPYSTSVSLEQAEKLAIKYLSDMKNSSTIATLAASATPRIAVKNSMTITKNNSPYFHIVNTTEGFVVVSSDSLYNPVIAYDSLSNLNLDLNNLHAGLSLWLDKHSYQLDYVRKNKNKYLDSVTNVNKSVWIALGGNRLNGEDTSKVNNSSSVATNSRTSLNGYAPVVFKTEPITIVSGSRVDPLIKSVWAQDYPWNQYCPVDPAVTGTLAGRDPVGCVAVAMGQIMFYWKFSNKGYNFANMVAAIDPDKPTTTWPVNNPGGFTGSARMMSDIGLTDGSFYTDFTHGFTSSKFMHYAATGSDANVEYCETVFKKFGYTSAQTSQSYATQMISGQASGTYYMGKITDEVQARRPVIVSGYTGRVFNGINYGPDINSKAHAWVIEGSNKQTYRMGTRIWYRNNDGSTYYQDNITSIVTTYFVWNNFGQGGLGNGWYDAASNYTTDGSGNNYQYFQILCYNIHP